MTSFAERHLVNRAVRFGRRVEDVVAVEGADADKGPVVGAYLEAATRPDTRRRLETGAARVPVFRLDPR